MTADTFGFRQTLVVGSTKKVKLPIDVIIQPKRPRKNHFPILIEAKSAGDFTNTNKRRKEEATKIPQLQDTYGADTQLVLFLCGYFDSGYLGYEAAEGIDWIWERAASTLEPVDCRDFCRSRRYLRQPPESGGGSVYSTCQFARTPVLSPWGVLLWIRDQPQPTGSGEVTPLLFFQQS